MGDVPAASWADAAYLTAIPLTAAALSALPALRGRAAGKTRSPVDGLVLAAALFFLAWTLVFEPIRRELDLNSLAGLVTFAYPLGDVVIILLVVLVVRGTTGREPRRPLVSARRPAADCIFGCVATLIAPNNQNYTSGNVIDTGWFAGYLAIALGALNAKTHPAEQAGSLKALTPVAILAPFLPMLAALFFAAIRIQLGHHLDHVTLVVAFVLVALVLVRQLLLMIDIFARPDQIEGSVGDRLIAALGEAVPDKHPKSDVTVRGTPMTQTRTITRAPARRRLGDTQSVLVLFLSILLTLVAIYDLFLLTSIAQ